MESETSQAHRLSLLNSFSSLRPPRHWNECVHILSACLAKSLHGKFVCRAAESSEVSRGREFVRACNWRRVPCRGLDLFPTCPAKKEKRKKKREKLRIARP